MFWMYTYSFFINLERFVREHERQVEDDLVENKTLNFINCYNYSKNIFDSIG